MTDIDKIFGLFDSNNIFQMKYKDTIYKNKVCELDNADTVHFMQCSVSVLRPWLAVTITMCVSQWKIRECL